MPDITTQPYVPIARPIPMKRELKALHPDWGMKILDDIARLIPIKGN